MKRVIASQSKRKTTAEKEIEQAERVLQRLVKWHTEDLQARIDRIRERLDNLTKTP